MLAGCGRAGDFAGDPTDHFIPEQALASPITLLLSFTYHKKHSMPQGTQVYVYLNNQLADREGFSGKEYKLGWHQLVSIESIIVVPVPPSLVQTGYDPLCGRTDFPSMYIVGQNFLRGFVLASEHFSCPNIPIYDERGRTNFITPAMKQEGFTIRPGSLVALKDGRKRLVNGKTISKKHGDDRFVLSIKDYRYHSQFDRQAFRVQPTRILGCSRLPAHRTTVFIRTADGNNALSEHAVKKI